MRTAALLLLALGGSCRPPTGDSADPARARDLVRAERVTAASADELLTEGARADGRVGDFALRNDLLTAIFDDVGWDPVAGIPTQRHRAPSGATLLDLAPAGGQDALVQVLQVLDCDPASRVRYQVLEPVEQGRAIKATGRVLDPGRSLGLPLDDEGLVQGLVVTTTWRAWDRLPWVEAETVVANQSGATLLDGSPCDLVVSDGAGLRPFLPTPGHGYAVADGEDLLVPWLAFGGEEAVPGGYGVLAPEEGMLAVHLDKEADGRLRGLLLGPPQGLDGSLAPGAQRSWVRRYTAADGLDPAQALHNVLEAIEAEEGGLHIELGIGELQEVALSVGSAGPGEITFERTDPARYLDQQGGIEDGGALPMSAAQVQDGSWTAWLPLGSYRVALDAPGADPEPVALELRAGVREYGVLAGEGLALAPLAVTLLDAQGTPNALPVRLTVVGLGGTDSPDLGHFDLAGGALAAGHRVWTAGSELALTLPEGAYRLLLSRGPRWPLARVEVHVPTSEAVVVQVPGAALDADGFRSLDPFTASIESIVGGTGPEALAFALCGEDLDAVVRAEAGGGAEPGSGCEGQQVLTGALGALDVPRLGAPRGDGWLVAFPVAGSIPGPGLLPAAWLDLARAGGAGAAALLTPRAEGSAGAATGLFEAHSFQREQIGERQANAFLDEESAEGTRILDAGAIEVLSPADPWNTRAVLQDWLALLDAGHRLLPLAASHAAWLEADRPGAVRTMVRSEGGGDAELLADLAAGDLFVTSGPLLDVELSAASGSARPGGTLVAETGEVLTLRVRVRAADWVPLTQARAFAGGRDLWSWQPAPGEALEVEATVDFALAQESWVLLEAGDPEEVPTGDFASVYPGVPVYAVSAPIWIRHP